MAIRPPDFLFAATLFAIFIDLWHGFVACRDSGIFERY
jgi:hypothetical protein